HLHPRAEAVEHRGEHRLARHVGAVGGAGGVGVGQVAGDGVHAHGLGGHGRTGDLHALLEAHRAYPLPWIAAARPLSFMFTKVRLVWKSSAFWANSACSTPSSTVLPSCDGRLGTR